MTQTDVLIVGAGPTGLTLAICLRQAGVDCSVLERRDTLQNTSRAGVIHAHTLEMLEGLGVTAALLAEGMRLTRFCARDRDAALLSLDFAGLPSRHAYLLMIPQDRTERILLDRLRELGGEVRWGCNVEALQQQADGVIATLQTATGTERIHARYAVGADGMHSTLREAAGIGFPGARYEESFILADVDMDWPLGREEVSLLLAPEGMVVIAPLPGTQRYRIVATVADAPEHPDLAVVQALLDARGPQHAHGKVRQVLWSSRFRVHHRVADRYRQGRMLIMGDAAHVHSPAGGQGMNTGLVDACVLGQALAEVLSGRQNESVLDRYAEIRRPAAEQVIAMAQRLTQMATQKGWLRCRLRNLALRALNCVPAFKRRLAMNLSGLARRNAAQL